MISVSFPSLLSDTFKSLRRNLECILLKMPGGYVLASTVCSIPKTQRCIQIDCNYASCMNKTVSLCCFNKCKTRLEYSSRWRMVSFVVCAPCSALSTWKNRKRTVESAPLFGKTSLFNYFLGSAFATLSGFSISMIAVPRSDFLDQVRV